MRHHTLACSRTNHQPQVHHAPGASRQSAHAAGASLAYERHVLLFACDWNVMGKNRMDVEASSGILRAEDAGLVPERLSSQCHVCAPMCS